MKLRYLGTLAAGFILVAACGPSGATQRPAGTPPAAATGPAGTAPTRTAPTGTAPPGTAPPGTAPTGTAPASLPPGATPLPPIVTIGVDLPLSGNSVINGQPTENGILLAVQE